MVLPIQSKNLTTISKIPFLADRVAISAPLCTIRSQTGSLPWRSQGCVEDIEYHSVIPFHMPTYPL